MMRVTTKYTIEFIDCDRRYYICALAFDEHGVFLGRDIYGGFASKQEAEGAVRELRGKNICRERAKVSDG